jgi:diguanylate cyclase
VSIRVLNIEHAEHPLGKVTASAGITTSQPSTEDVTPAMLIKAADAFLYLAKNTGRNRWCSADAPQGQPGIGPT